MVWRTCVVYDPSRLVIAVEQLHNRERRRQHLRSSFMTVPQYLLQDHHEQRRPRSSKPTTSTNSPKPLRLFLRHLELYNRWKTQINNKFKSCIPRASSETPFSPNSVNNFRKKRIYTQLLNPEINESSRFFFLFFELVRTRKERSTGQEESWHWMPQSRRESTVAEKADSQVPYSNARKLWAPTQVVSTGESWGSINEQQLRRREGGGVG
jgi:hypothetical protein